MHIEWVEIPCCPICGEARKRPFHKYVIDLEHRFVQCAGCGVLYLSPRPRYDDEFIEEMYPIDKDGAPDDFKDDARRYYHDTDLLEQAETLLGRKGRLLDVGCNNGALLLAARERGWETKGVDISRERVELSRKRGLDVDCADITEEPFDGPGFDLVSACHVVEHTPDPVRFMEALKARTADDGLLVIEVPNIMGMDLRFKRFLERAGLKKTRIHDPAHLFEFTREAFENLAGKTGLEVVECYTYSRYRRAPGPLKRLYQAFLKRVHTGNKFRFFLRKRSGQDS